MEGVVFMFFKRKCKNTDYINFIDIDSASNELQKPTTIKDRELHPFVYLKTDGLSLFEFQLDRFCASEDQQQAVVVHSNGIGVNEMLSRRQIMALATVFPDSDLIWVNSESALFNHERLSLALNEFMLSHNYRAINFIGWGVGGLVMTLLVTQPEAQQWPTHRLILWDPPMTKGVVGIIRSSRLRLQQGWFRQILRLYRGTSHWQQQLAATTIPKLIVAPRFSRINRHQRLRQLTLDSCGTFRSLSGTDQDLWFDNPELFARTMFWD